MKKHRVFKDFMNDVFIETGTFIGDGVQSALDFGFKKVYSIELSEELYHKCKVKFEKNKNVNLFLGDSGEVLKGVLSKVKCPATFWLDGHYHPAGKNRKDNPDFFEWGLSNDGVWSPLLRELDIISKHEIKNHTIIIDDMREMKTAQYGSIDSGDLFSRLLKINNKYKFRFYDGATPRDILVAHLGG